MKIRRKDLPIEPTRRERSRELELPLPLPPPPELPDLRQPESDESGRGEVVIDLFSSDDAFSL